MTYPYTQAEYDAFGWSTLSKASANFPPAETYGLDYESAAEATPHWYAVSSGDGNNGVSHMFPDYYVRTADPYRLAELAMLTSFKTEYREQVKDEMTVDGEADYVITAVLANPLDEEYDEDDEMWCDVNGAYLLIDVFPVDDDFDPAECFPTAPYGKPAYDSIADCFGED